MRGSINLLKRLKGYGKPIWITEINRRNGSQGNAEKEQAEYLRRVAAQLAADPGIGALFVYELLDEPYHGSDNGESFYGLVELARDPKDHWQVKRRKPAFDAFQRAAAGTKCEGSRVPGNQPR